jgi:predicted NBD/HSP70 family sugar kinase
MPHKFIAGVDLGATNVRVVVANEDGEVESRRSYAHGGAAPEPAIERIGRTVDELARQVWVGAKAAAIGVALPGMVDPATGTVASAANMEGWGSVPLARLLGGPRDAIVAVENDANAAAVGEEWMGAARGLRHVVFVALGTGIGAGIVIDGRPYRGSHALAGEVAYFPMLREHVTSSDWQHCLEGLVGGRAADARAAAILGEGRSAPDLFAAAAKGHAAAAAWMRETQEFLAMAIVDIAALLDPDMVVVGGGVAVAQGETFLAPVRDMAHACLPVAIPITLSELGADAQVMGAVKLALDRMRADA